MFWGSPCVLGKFHILLQITKAWSIDMTDKKTPSSLQPEYWSLQNQLCVSLKTYDWQHNRKSIGHWYFELLGAIFGVPRTRNKYHFIRKIWRLTQSFIWVKELIFYTCFGKKIGKCESFIEWVHSGATFKRGQNVLWMKRQFWIGIRWTSTLFCKNPEWKMRWEDLPFFCNWVVWIIKTICPGRMEDPRQTAFGGRLRKWHGPMEDLRERKIGNSPQNLTRLGIVNPPTPN